MHKKPMVHVSFCLPMALNEGLNQLVQQRLYANRADAIREAVRRLIFADLPAFSITNAASGFEASARQAPHPPIQPTIRLPPRKTYRKPG